MAQWLANVKAIPMKKPAPPTIAKFPAARQKQLDHLLEKNSSETLAEKEKAKLKRLVLEAEELMVANAQRLAAFAQREATRTPTAAVPVTVWVQPQNGGR